MEIAKGTQTEQSQMEAFFCSVLCLTLPCHHLPRHKMVVVMVMMQQIYLGTTCLQHLEESLEDGHDLDILLNSDLGETFLTMPMFWIADQGQPQVLVSVPQGCTSGEWSLKIASRYLSGLTSTSTEAQLSASGAAVVHYTDGLELQYSFAKGEGLH